MESGNLLDKLERVERTINVYDKKTEDLIEEMSIDLPLERLKAIVTPNEGDPLLYMGYVLDAAQLEEINNELSRSIKPDYNAYYYVLECHGIYNW